MGLDKTRGIPDPTTLDSIEQFIISGYAIHPITVDHLEFRCWLSGTRVYVENFSPVTTQLVPGYVWTESLPFIIPSVAPSSEYEVEIAGVDAGGSDLFAVRTAF